MEINKALQQVAPPPREDRNSPLWQAAQGMEAHFMKEMMREMRKTVQESPEEANNRGLQIFRGMLDDQYAETAARTQGIGLAELIVRQAEEAQRSVSMRQPVAVRDVNKNDTVKE